MESLAVDALSKVAVQVYLGPLDRACLAAVNLDDLEIIVFLQYDRHLVFAGAFVDHGGEAPGVANVDLDELASPERGAPATDDCQETDGILLLHLIEVFAPGLLRHLSHHLVDLLGDRLSHHGCIGLSKLG